MPNNSASKSDPPRPPKTVDMVWMGGAFSQEAISSLEYGERAFPGVRKNIWVWDSGQHDVREAAKRDWFNSYTAAQHAWELHDARTKLIPRLSAPDGAFEGLNSAFSGAEVLINYHLANGNALVPQRAFSYGLAALGDRLVIEPGITFNPAAAINMSTFSKDLKVSLEVDETQKTSRVAPWALLLETRTRWPRNRATGMPCGRCGSAQARRGQDNRPRQRRHRQADKQFLAPGDLRPV